MVRGSLLVAKAVTRLFPQLLFGLGLGGLDMRFWAIFCPPIAVLMAGKPFQSLIALVLWLCLWIPGSIYAWGIVSDYKDDKRMNKMVKAQAKANAKAEKANHG